MNLKQRNNKLYNELRLFVEELERILKCQKTMFVTKSIWKKDETEDLFIREDKRTPDYTQQLFRAIIRMEKTDSTYENVKCEINKDEIWSKYFNTLIGSEMMGWQQLQIFGVLLQMSSYCLTSHTNKVSLSLVRFEEIIHQLEIYFNDQNIEYVTKIPLYGIVIEDKIIINREFSLEILSDSDICELIENGQLFISQNPWQGTHVKCPPRTVLIIKSYDKKTDCNLSAKTLLLKYEEITTRLKVAACLIINLLTLIINVKVSKASTIRTSNSPQSPKLIEFNSLSNPFHLLRKKNLTIEEEQKFHKLWNILNKNGDKKYQKYLRIALQRYSTALSENSPDDKLIDFMICAEALFLQDGNAELSYKLAHRAALLLGENNPQKQNEIYKLFKDAYKLRSDIVHGSKSLEQGNKSEFSTLELEKILKEALDNMFDKAINNPDSTSLVDWDKMIFPERIESQDQ